MFPLHALCRRDIKGLLNNYPDCMVFLAQVFILDWLFSCMPKKRGLLVGMGREAWMAVLVLVIIVVAIFLYTVAQRTAPSGFQVASGSAQGSGPPQLSYNPRYNAGTAPVITLTGADGKKVTCTATDTAYRYSPMECKDEEGNVVPNPAGCEKTFSYNYAVCVEDDDVDADGNPLTCESKLTAEAENAAYNYCAHVKTADGSECLESVAVEVKNLEGSQIGGTCPEVGTCDPSNEDCCSGDVILTCCQKYFKGNPAGGGPCAAFYRSRNPLPAVVRNV